MPTPREVFDKLSEGVTSGDWSELSALYAEDTVVEHPQRPPAPTRVVGRATVHEQFTRGLVSQLRLRRKNVLIHETTDPELIVAEYDYSGEALATGKTFEAANIQVLRVRDGLIQWSRDYHDYLRIAAARDGLEELADGAEKAEITVEPLPERPVSTADPKSPRGVFERLVYGVSDGKWDELADLYAEETHVTHPFLPGAPALKSRQDLREHFAQVSRSATKIQARDLVIYQSTDPEVVIGEFVYQGESVRPYRVSNIFVMRVRDGLIVESRDYGDYVALAAAGGWLRDLIKRL
ncbi:Ketosteroid isomerase-related protein [Amycolatopsis xylanica]|uniref:Ketosteroid isomerase-related protein n=1 Tax=Amycolatopsis xylanica TaxID=589385 RepID=A0A1H3CYN9_9PSEU|nr:nuclear transport factor 2 family protein [Amycolatopsis xylanica]SDX58664.1 Ketosteroid isomerase-related protein [Amycolatopsis xylanica]